MSCNGTSFNPDNGKGYTDIHRTSFIFRGGEWTVRYGDEESTSVSPDGEIGWSDTALEVDARHQSGNTGDEPIDLVWITLKPGCMAEN